MNAKDTPGRDDLEELRRLAKEIGMPGEVRPADHGIVLESPQEFLARMRRTAEAVDKTATPDELAHRRRRVGTWLCVAAAAIVGIATVAVANPWAQEEATAETPPVLSYQFAKATDISYAPGKDARSALLALAKAARAQANAPLTSARIQYVQSTNFFSSGEETAKGFTTKLIPTTVQTWTSPDGAQTVLETPSKPLGPDGRGLSKSEPDPETHKYQTFPAGNIDANRIKNIGSTPAEIRQELVKTADCDPNATDTATAQCLYQEISGLFTQYVIPPKTAAIFWTILANQPGFRTLGDVTDRAGRAGVGISVISSEAPQFREVMIISRATGQLLGVEEILIKSNRKLGLKAPAVNNFTAILISRRTASRPAH